MTAATIRLYALFVLVGMVISDKCIGLNSRTEMCCLLGVEQRYTNDGREKECCFNQTFVPDTQLCCNKSVVPRIADNGNMTKCCGGIQYNLQDRYNLCCHDNLHTLLPGENSTCCGKSKIDSATEVCCKDSHGSRRVHQKQPNMKCCQSGYYDKSTHYCYHNRHILPHRVLRCGSQMYDLRSQKCCGGVLYSFSAENNPQYGCCGSDIYNMTEKKCCGYENRLIPAKMSCCNGGPYNKSTERCCGSGPIKFTKNTEQCCGTDLYDSAVQGCCGTKSYNKYTHQCCFPDGAIIRRVSDAKCCRAVAYNSSADVCCLHQDKVTIMKKIQRNHDSCCLSDSSGHVESYSSRTHYCSLGTVVSVGTQMCGASVIDVDKDVCCQGVFYKDGKLEGKKCCGVVSFLPREQICCDKVLFKKSKRRRCGRHSNKISGMTKRSHRNLKTHGICRICHKSHRYFAKAIKSKVFNICRLQAFKVRIVAQKPFKKNLQRIKMFIQKDLYSDNTPPKGKIEMHLPCNCPVRSKKTILFIKSVDFKRPIRLGDSDILLPWSSKIGNLLKRQQKKCKTQTLVISKDIVGYRHDSYNVLPKVNMGKNKYYL